MTTSTLFPQQLQRWTLFLASALAETSVFDFPFSAIAFLPPFYSISVKDLSVPYYSRAHAFPTTFFLGIATSGRAKHSDETFTKL